ncbi:flagellar assembly peptidoglycan hydrolase FlgJ [Aliikangiella maris]|uniref:Flagellar assembly peptidoglycan hydrolase FlgJ n=2 Tax=Aliikangiella maris TaxID=3162458 RepID=A0ABV3MPH9_9GAMM
MKDFMTQSMNMQGMDRASIYNDLNSLDAIRRQGKVDESGAIEKAAKEFESFFMNMMLKSMRQASEVIGDESPFSSPQEKMFIGMLDEQMAVELSQQGHFGIADLMLSQLTQSAPENTMQSVMPAIPQTQLASKSSKINPSARIPTDILPANKAMLSNSVKVQSAALNSDSLKAEISKIEYLKKEDVNTNLVTTSSLDSVALEAETLGKKVNEVALKPTKRALFDSVQNFVSTLLPYATEAAKKLSVDPKVLLAQAALETGWGKYVMHDEQGVPGHNLFGIKAGKQWEGEVINIDTLEVTQQQFKKVNASFRKYENFAESFQDYVNFVTQSPRYQKALEVSENPEQYLNALQNSGYATDPQYAQKIMRIYQGQTELNVESIDSESE